VTVGEWIPLRAANATPLERGQYEHGEPSSPKPPQPGFRAAPEPADWGEPIHAPSGGNRLSGQRKWT